MGFEPITYRLKADYSTIELMADYLNQSQVGKALQQPLSQSVRIFSVSIPTVFLCHCATAHAYILIFVNITTRPLFFSQVAFDFVPNLLN